MKGITLESNDAAQLVQLADVLLSKGQASAAAQGLSKSTDQGWLKARSRGAIALRHCAFSKPAKGRGKSAIYGSFRR